MNFKSSLLKTWVLSSLFFLAACTSKHGDSVSSDPVEQALANGTYNVALESVSSDKCLNLEKYFETIRAFPAATKVRKMTSDFRMRTGYNLPRNYFLRLAAGNFQILDTDMSQLPDFAEMKQTDCTSVIFSTEGHDQTYKVTGAKKDSLTYQNDWGGETTVTWKSPTSLQFDVTSAVGDYLCDSSSQGKAMLTQQVNWGGAGVLTESVRSTEISQSFLALVAEATGFSMDSLYTVASGPTDSASPSADRMISVSQLKALQALPVRNELLQCY